MYDLLVIGSGIAGLTTALEAARFGLHVLLATKERLEESNTWYAQGGIAAALGDDDTPDAHYDDTLAAGAGLCDPAAVRVLVDEGPAAVRQLAALGVPFDRHGAQLALTREAAHSQRRIVHAGGDATGAAVETTLADAVRAAGITVREQTVAVELLVEAGVCVGARLMGGFKGGEPCLENPPAAMLRARAVVLATGGAGQLYQATTNPGVATGDGLALAYRAGAALANLEFFQFHPTALALAPQQHAGAELDPTTLRLCASAVNTTSPAFLISEAVRGEGGYLRNAAGERFMQAVHPQAELAPRDVVARTIAAEMLRRGEDCVYLDITHLDAGLVRRRFPTIARACAAQGLDITADPIPVAPAAHYHMGGVVSDLWGRTSLPGLYACGEVAMTGVHGANRLASNSLLEGAVWGARIARAADNWLRRTGGDGTRWDVQPSTLPATLVDANALLLRPAALSTPPEQLRAHLPRLMWRHVGIVRAADGLHTALAQISSWRTALGAQPTAVTGSAPGDAALANLLLVAELTTHAALLREESRGAHTRSDFPGQREHWRRAIVLRS